MDVAARLEVVERENEMLRERIRTLEQALCGAEPPPIQLGLTGSEGSLFGLLMERTMVTKDMAMSVLYRDFAKDEAEPKIVDVFVCKIRKKIKPFGISIETRWGLGYEMTAASKQIVRDMRGEIQVAA